VTCSVNGCGVQLVRRRPSPVFTSTPNPMSWPSLTTCRTIIIIISSSSSSLIQPTSPLMPYYNAVWSSPVTASRIREQSIVMSVSVCVSVCLSVSSSHISWNRASQFYRACCRSSVLLWRHCNTLCTSGFVRWGVTFSCNCLMAR